MTALRRQRTGTRLWVTGFLVSAVLSAAPGSADNITERVVTDVHSGLAISGFDPVAYFTDGGPRLGVPEIEYRAEGVIWRFRNAGNRAAFAADPHVYRPRFGGYDPIAIGRGVATAGHPEIWAIAGNRLYLFYNEEARARFLVDPGAAITGADVKWAEVLRTLAP